MHIAFGRGVEAAIRARQKVQADSLEIERVHV